MRRLIRPAVMLATGLALVSASAVGLAQERKGAAPAPAKGLRLRVGPVQQRGDLIEGFMKKQILPAGEVEKLLGDLPQVDPQREALAKQFAQQLRPAVRVELQLIRSACAPTVEQRLALIHAADKAVRDVAGAWAGQQVKMMRGRWQGGNPMRDPAGLVRERVAAAVKEHLTPEQAARYEAEVGERAEARKRAAVQNLVLQFDRDLVLNADQRERITAALERHWNDGWTGTVEMIQYGNQYYPNVPDSAVVPFLTRAQKEVWRTLPKNANVFTGTAIRVPMNLMLDRDPLEPEVEAPVAPGVVPGAPPPPPPPAPAVERPKAAPAK